MPKRSAIPPDLPVFAGLPVSFVHRGGGASAAVHVGGRLGFGRLPVVCVPGHVRNMSDFMTFATAMRNLLGMDWPHVLIDLPGRGRAGWRADKTQYTSPQDAEMLATVLKALAIDRAILVGLGQGGQVIMALGAIRPSTIAAAILIDAGPLTDPRGLVRQRTNLGHVLSSRSEVQAVGALRRILATDYPGRDAAALDKLAARLFVTAGRSRPLPLFDPALVERLKGFSADDEFVPQWPLFNTLATASLMLLRTQLTDRLRKEVFEEMARRRPDAVTFTISDQGSPALLDGADETGAIADFITYVQKLKG
ncbi:MAG: alpha/beta hydrolase [Alphaproteobacteria bacterium]|nr:alpha/beta hydrolase [Alphaproteobacteria bacterium]